MNDTIFYIDDDMEDIDIVEEILTNMGHPTRMFQNCEDLMHLLGNPPPPPRMIFIDLNMPRIDGLSVLTQIRAHEEFRKVPIIMFSSSPSPIQIMNCREHGADMFITKGYSMKKIRRAFEYVFQINWETFKPTSEEFLYVA